jgi:hypothetical protein
MAPQHCHPCRHSCSTWTVHFIAARHTANPVLQGMCGADCSAKQPEQESCDRGHLQWVCQLAEPAKAA